MRGRFFAVDLHPWPQRRVGDAGYDCHVLVGLWTGVAGEADLALARGQRDVDIEQQLGIEQRAVELARTLHPFDLSLKDTQSCIDRLKDQGPVFVVGYCYGGSVAWAAATKLDDVAAASAYYGSMIPAFAAEAAPRVPVIAHFGRYDRGIPMEGVEATIACAHPLAEVHVYEAGHGFNSDRRKDYHEPSAELARDRTLTLFRETAG